MSDPKPMDPERLAEATRLLLAWSHGSDAAALVIELLADRDYQEQRAEHAALDAAMFESQRQEIARLKAEVKDGQRVTANEIKILQALGQRPDGTWSESVAGIGGRIVGLETEVARLRSRVRVEASDVERILGEDLAVAVAKAEAWLSGNGWAAEQVQHGQRVWKYGGHWVCIEPPSAGRIAVAVRHVARSHKDSNKCGLDILDEMAALSPAEAPAPTSREAP